MTNKYRGYCSICNSVVPRNGGILKKENGRWKVYHLTCAKDNSIQVNTFRFNGGDNTEYTRNVNGRCEDAPCCGCCTI